jgi:hypothetical protein
MMSHYDTSYYIKNNYGICKHKKCLCISSLWNPTYCSYWVSSECNNFDELREWQKVIVNENSI